VKRRKEKPIELGSRWFVLMLNKPIQPVKLGKAYFSRTSKGILVTEGCLLEVYFPHGTLKKGSYFNLEATTSWE